MCVCLFVYVLLVLFVATIGIQCLIPLFQVLFQIDFNFTMFFVVSFALVCINIFLFKFLNLIFCIMVPL